MGNSIVKLRESSKEVITTSKTKITDADLYSPKVFHILNILLIILLILI